MRYKVYSYTCKRYELIKHQITNPGFKPCFTFKSFNVPHVNIVTYLGFDKETIWIRSGITYVIHLVHGDLAMGEQVTRQQVQTYYRKLHRIYKEQKEKNRRGYENHESMSVHSQTL